jgi:hypothetical protein
MITLLFEPRMDRAPGAPIASHESDALKSAPGLIFDKQKTAWIPAT